MKKFLTFLIVFLFCLQTAVFAYQRVSGYTRKNGTYVAPHYRSNSDSSRLNNWSSSGNVNPYTGKKGYRNW